MRIHKSLKLSMATAFALSSLPAQFLHAADELQANESRIFLTAPSPEELLHILFPPRYRGAKPADSPSDDTNVFGMVINFEFDSANILPESEPMLQSVGEMMGIDQVTGRSIVVEGHTDAVGSDAYNQKLSERRANAIKDYLIDNYGVAPRRLVAVGKGERQPALVDDPDAPLNRRATFRSAKKLVLK